MAAADVAHQSKDIPPSPAMQDIQVKVNHQGTSHIFTLPGCATLADLSNHAFETLSIPVPNQKLLISPKPGLLKPPFPDLAVSTVATRKITLLGSTAAQVSSLNKTISNSQAQLARRENKYSGPLKPATPARTRDWKTLHDSTTYTFLQIRPLEYLPQPHRSTKFLERLRDDPGIKASMAKHKWTVPLLTEMNPAEHTTHEGKTLGLNRNGGEVIELRLRTDAYDGYRDYKTIRKTLCHELAHNVHSEHDRKFWDLCHEIEREVERADLRSGGHALSDQEIYIPDEEDVVADHGGWSGGEFVLGSSSAPETVGGGAPVSRREIMARAAEERMKREKDTQGKRPES